MNNKKMEWILFVISIVCFALLAISFLVMPFEEQLMPRNPMVWNILIGCWFWVSLLLGMMVQIVLARICKKHRKYRNDVERSSGGRKVGVVRFFQNKYARIADILMGVSWVGLVLSCIWTNASDYICNVFIALSVFTFCMHCILNGQIFFELKNK